jgi:hypothetical protein
MALAPVAGPWRVRRAASPAQGLGRLVCGPARKDLIKRGHSHGRSHFKSQSGSNGNGINNSNSNSAAPVQLARTGRASTKL